MSFGGDVDPFAGAGNSIDISDDDLPFRRLKMNSVIFEDIARIQAEKAKAKRNA